MVQGFDFMVWDCGSTLRAKVSYQSFKLFGPGNVKPNLS